MFRFLKKFFQLFSKKPNERVLANKAQVEGAPPYAEIYWVPTRGAKHCDDCLILGLGKYGTHSTYKLIQQLANIS